MAIPAARRQRGLVARGTNRLQWPVQRWDPFGALVAIVLVIFLSLNYGGARVRGDGAVGLGLRW
jgi:hypothetical protein